VRKIADTMPFRKLISRPVRVLITIVCALLAATMPPPAQAQPAPLRVAIKPLVPFVVFDGERNTGFSIDLWKEIAQRIKREYEFVRVETVKDQLEAVRSNRADLAITGISITREREEFIDFSLPYFDAGLQVMTSARAERIPIGNILANVFSAAVLPLLGVVLLIMLVAAHIYWLIERRQDPEFPSAYLPGVWEGLWWAMSTVLTSQFNSREPRSVPSRLFGIAWLFFGLLLISNLTATITSEITLRSLEGAIRGEQDLPGKRVGTVANSTANRYLSTRGIAHTTAPDVRALYTQLDRGEIDAVVYDAPVLYHYSIREGSGKVKMAGTLFNPESYGIAFPSESRLREAINRVLLELREDGTYEEIYARWFGARQ
jgi:polar amino acid transport system substrate-binding protein